MVFKVGSRVRVTGLVSASAEAHNGKPGTVCSTIAQITGPVFIVKLDDGRFLKIKPSNMAPIPPGNQEGRKLLCRLNVCDEQSIFTARPLLLMAFQSRQKQLQANWTPIQRASFRATVARIPYSPYCPDYCLKAEHLRTLLSAACFSTMLAVKFMHFQSKCNIELPLKHATSILSRYRDEMPVSRLGTFSGVAMRARHRPVSCNLISRSLNLPRGIAFDSEGNLAVADGMNHCIKVFRWTDGGHLCTFGSMDSGAARFRHPWGVAFDDAGHIVVSEYEGHCVQVLRYSDGAHVCTFGGYGSGNGQFIYPSGIAVDSDGNVAVFDDGNCRVQVHRLCDGTYIRTIGSKGSGNGQFGGGRGVAFDSENNLVVADRANHRVQVLRYSDGAYLRSIGHQGSGITFNSPCGVAFDAAGCIAVVERDNHRVQVLRYKDSKRICIIGKKGSRDADEFNEPSGGIAVDRDGGIVIADTHNNRVRGLK
jgi:sugar lactone lactonase YvrE